MKIEAMLEWSTEERTAKEMEWRQALFTLKLQKATGQLDNPMKLREIRKDIARLKTIDHLDAARAAVLKTHAVHETAAAASPADAAAATAEPAGTSVETDSSKGKKAPASPKKAGKGAAKAKGAGARTSGKKSAGAGKPHSPSKKKASSPSGKASSKNKSAAKKKSR
ncbi:MAG: 50S ribosomal protein L29 [Thermoanaerobaculia bacterium]